MSWSEQVILCRLKEKLPPVYSSQYKKLCPEEKFDPEREEMIHHDWGVLIFESRAYVRTEEFFASGRRVYVYRSTTRIP